MANFVLFRGQQVCSCFTVYEDYSKMWQLDRDICVLLPLYSDRVGALFVYVRGFFSPANWT